jgi:hypothetical protein
VIDFIKQYGFPILAIVIGACVVGLTVYLILQRRRRRAEGRRARVSEPAAD